MNPGYKQTEVGVIPEDWEVGSLKQAFPRLDAGVSVNSDDSESSDYYILKTSAVRNGNVNIKEAKPVIRSDYERLKCPVKKGSIIISRMNTPAMVGECGFSTIDAPNTFLPDRLWQIEPSSPDYDFQWLNYLLNTEKYSAAIRAAATGTSNSMKNIAKERLLEISIPKPPCPEQERIAEALSDMDELISSLEKLIEKKKAIKQGAMQELLTGKRRLPGFSGEWKSLQLRQLGRFVGGGTPSTNKTDWWKGKIPWISSSDLDDNQVHNVQIHRYISQDAVAHSATCLCPVGTVLVVSRVGVGKVAVAPVDLCTSQDFTNIIIERCNSTFIAYVLSDVMRERASMTQGTSIKGVTSNEIGSIIITIPAKQEQDEIVKVLDNIDKDIDAIRKKYMKACQIKQGMMQQLLTGTIRLV